MRYNSNRIEKMAKDIGLVVSRLQELCKEHEGYSALWEVAVRKGDGINEGLYREKLHMATDQILDCRTRSLQLQKNYEEGV